MTRLLLTLVLASTLFTVAHANEANDYISANVLWADNAEYQRLDNEQDADYISANALWADDAEFQRMNGTKVDHDYINANMLWSDNSEFQAH